jgi:hypothetical protein
MRPFALLGAALAFVVFSALPAVATNAPVPVPEPGTLSTLATGLAAGVIAYRWIRRR